MATMIARVMLAIGAAMGFFLYAMVLALAAVPMLIVSIMRLAARRPEPAPPMPLPIVSLEGVTIQHQAREELAAR